MKVERHFPMVSRRGFVGLAGAALVGSRVDWESVSAPWRPRPSAAQLQWQRDELALFLHFGVNTFSDREWGDGKEDPQTFSPTALDARQWARTARQAGFKAMILTAKHHDGFCLWPTETTRHSVVSSPWRGGQGDVVKEFADACRAEGLRVGLYCSPWDRNAAVYGDSERYNDMFCAQIRELLTRYGQISEVWFDGANGEGPNGRKQVYDWPRFFGLVKSLQPQAVIFSDAGPDVRWIGNERGAAGETNWSMVDPAAVPYPGADGEAVIKMLQEGTPTGTVWRPGETDVSIRPGWFYHPAEDTRVRTPDDLVGLYFSSVGRNSKLLLNVPPTRDGLLHTADVQSLLGMRRAREDVLGPERRVATRPSEFRAMSRTSARVEISLRAPADVRVVELREQISEGQRVARYSVDGFDGAQWHRIAAGTTIGYCKLDRFTSRRLTRVRVALSETVERPIPISVQLYGSEG